MPTTPLSPALDILVLADSPASLAALSLLVLNAGHKPSTAQSATEALARIQDHEPDLLLLDLQSTELDGCEFTRRLRLGSPASLMKVIVLSPSPGDEHVIQALQSGADDCLPHPVNVGLLEAKLAYFYGVQWLQTRLVRLAQRQLNIIDNIADAVFTLDADGGIHDMNSAAHALFDSISQVDGAVPWQGGDCLSLLGVRVDELLTQPECTLRRADGETLTVAISHMAWDEDGLTRYTLVLRDLTEQRALEVQQNEFFATVSHELRTPLTSVLGSLGLLAGGAAGSLPAAALQLTTVAQRNGKRLSRLIDDILDLSKMRSEQFVLHQRMQPVGPILTEALSASEAYANSFGVQLAAEGIDEHGATELQLDAHRFLQVMANLLSNAIKHSPAGELVRLRLLVSESVLRVSVIDRGPGVAAGFHQQLFKQFSKADIGHHKDHSSTGLGLYISRLLVERMGGEISADPAGPPPSVGASFSVRLPLEPRPTSHPEAA